MTETFAIILYVLGSILLVVLIILGIKMIKMMDKINIAVDNINKKVDSLNGLFSIIDFTTNKFAMISDKVAEGITALIKKVFRRNKEDLEDE